MKAKVYVRKKTIGFTSLYLKNALGVVETYQRKISRSVAHY